VLQDGCQKHDIVLLISFETSSLLDRCQLNGKVGIGRSESGGHLYSRDVPPFLPRPDEEFASAATELKQTSFAA